MPLAVVVPADDATHLFGCDYDALNITNKFPVFFFFLQFLLLELSRDPRLPRFDDARGARVVVPVRRPGGDH